MASCTTYLWIAVLATYAVTISVAPPPYNLGYNYFDEMAQSYCAASYKYWTFAIRRDCRRAPTCAAMCQQATTRLLGFISKQRTRVACYDALHIKKQHFYLSPNTGYPQPQQGQPIMATYGYGRGGCTWKANHCGPNYCCCRAY